MPRFTKVEREALGQAIGEVQAGDDVAFFNNGCEVDDPPKGREQKRAVRLAKALATAWGKIMDQERAFAHRSAVRKYKAGQ